MFVHLHTHSDNSILNGVIKVDKIVKKAKEYEMPAVALTDTGAMYPTYSFFSKCKGEGIKPIIGAQVNIAPRTRFDKEPKKDEKTSEFVLLAKNLTGYLNIIKIVSKGHLEGFYYRPRVDKDLLKEFSEGVIALSGGENGEIYRNLLLGNNDKAKELALEFKEIYGEDFYLEIQRTGLHTQEIINPKIIELSKELDIPLVATNDVYYEKQEDSEAREILWCIDGGRLMSDPARKRPESNQQYFRTPAEMEELFKDLPEAIENTVKIAEKVEEYSIGFGKVQPIYPYIPEGETEASYLRKLVFDNAEKQFGYYDKDLEDRLNYELEVIHDKGYDGYFLVMWSIVNWARSNGILVSTRGSAAGCAISYAINITTLDPIRWGLFFERFLNPERKSLPDIDLDISDHRREDVINWVKETYGQENVVNVGALGKLTTKAAIRDVGRVLGIDLGIIDKLSKLVPVKFGRVLSINACISDELAGKDLKVVEENRPAIEEFRAIINSDPQFEKLVKYVQKIEGGIRHISTHACGNLITPTAVTNYCPVQIESGSGQRRITQFEGKYLEEVGLMKFDFLGLANLSIIDYSLKFIKQFKNIDLDIYNIPFDDKKAFELLQRGDTTAVFQLESAGMRKYLKELHPENLEEISAMCALYRPGPIQFIPNFINRKFGREEVKYLIPEIEDIMKISYGLPVYQEQILQIANKVAGYTLGEADNLRRAIGKKLPDVMAAEEKKFIEGVQKNTPYGEDIAKKLWAYAQPFADYGFNKAHSAVYAYVAYQTAYLKANYPTEFMAALMLSDIDNQDKLVRDILDAEARGIKLLPPDINKSDAYFRIEEEGVIRFGIGGLKGVGLKCINSIVDERNKNGEFTSLDDLCARIDHKTCPKGAIEALIKIGAMQQFGTRAGLLQIFEDIYIRSQKLKSTQSSGFVDIFASEDTSAVIVTKIPNIPEVEDIQKIQWETEILGIALTPSLLSKIAPYARAKKYTSLHEIQEKQDKIQVRLLGQVKAKKVIQTKKGDGMCFVDLVDVSGKVSVTVFPKLHVKVCDTFNEGDFITVRGKTQKRNDEVQVIADDIKMISAEDMKKKWENWARKNQDLVVNFESEEPISKNQEPEKSSNSQAPISNNEILEQNHISSPERSDVPFPERAKRVEGSLTSPDEGRTSVSKSEEVNNLENSPEVQNDMKELESEPVNIEEQAQEKIEENIEKKEDEELSDKLESVGGSSGASAYPDTHSGVIEIFVKRGTPVDELQRLNSILKEKRAESGCDVYVYLPNHVQDRKIKLEGKYSEEVKAIGEDMIEKISF